MTNEPDPSELEVTLGEHHTADITQQEEHAQDAIDRGVTADDAAIARGVVSEDAADARSGVSDAQATGFAGESKARSVSSDEQLAVAVESSRVSFQGVKYILYISIGCMLLMIFVSVLAWSTVRTHTETLVDIAKVNRANSERLIDCTTPEGECFKEGQARTVEVVGTLNATTVAAVYCSKALPATATIEQVQTCVDRIVAAD